MQCPARTPLVTVDPPEPPEPPEPPVVVPPRVAQPTGPLGDQVGAAVGDVEPLPIERREILCLTCVGALLASYL
jgi:hypothetical protein